MSFKLLWLLLGTEQKLFLAFVGLLILLLAIAEFSLISLLPVFTSIIQGTDAKAPSLFQKHFPIDFMDSFGQVSLLFVCLFFVASLLRTIIVWASFHISADRQTSVSSLLFKFYLRRSLVWHGNNPPSSVVSESLNEVKRTIEGVVNPIVQVFSQSIVIVSILLYLVIFDILATIILASVFLAVYGLLTFLLKSRIGKLGLVSKFQLSRALRLVNSSLTSIRHVKTLKAEPYFESAYTDAVRRFAQSEGWAHILANVPRYMVEAAIVSAMFATIFLRYSTNEAGQYNLDEVVQIFAVFVFAGFRLLPAVSIIQSAYANFTYVKSASSRVLRDLTDAAVELDENRWHEKTEPEKIHPRYLRGVVFRGLIFQPNVSNTEILSVDFFQLLTKGLHAIVGPSGSGKSSLADCVSGMHTEGLRVGNIEFLFDGSKVLNSSDPRDLIEWIAYSPQLAGIFSSSIEFDLEFPKSDEFRGEVSTRETLRQMLGEESFEALVGRNPLVKEVFPGEIQASVGQTLAISITRALASDRPITVLDEPNASFDVQTEHALHQLLVRLARTKGVYVVTHRLERLKEFDTVSFLTGGRVVGVGTHEMLLRNNRQYREFIDTSMQPHRNQS